MLREVFKPSTLSQIARGRGKPGRTQESAGMLEAGGADAEVDLDA